jgi:hypothetical protein
MEVRFLPDHTEAIQLIRLKAGPRSRAFFVAGLPVNSHDYRSIRQTAFRLEIL